MRDVEHVVLATALADQIDVNEPGWPAFCPVFNGNLRLSIDPGPVIEAFDERLRPRPAANPRSVVAATSAKPAVAI
jgi:hypothetical protein